MAAFYLSDNERTILSHPEFEDLYLVKDLSWVLCCYLNMNSKSYMENASAWSDLTLREERVTLKCHGEGHSDFEGLYFVKTREELLSNINRKPYV